MNHIRFLMGEEDNLKNLSVVPGRIYFATNEAYGISKLYLDDGSRMNIVPHKIDAENWNTQLLFKRVDNNSSELALGEIGFNLTNLSLWIGTGEGNSALISPHYLLSNQHWDSTTTPAEGPILYLTQTDSVTNNSVSFEIDPIPEASLLSSGIITTGDQNI